MDRARLGMSVRDALALDSFADVEVVAGSGGLDSLILHINVMEVPDILEWVREGDLLFSTLYALRDNPEEQIRLIPQLAAKKLAGLAIKPKRYINAIPLEVIAIADELNFPLLQLPPDTAFSQLMEPLLQEILDYQTNLLYRSEMTHNALLDILLHGGNLEELTAELSRLLCCPAVVLNNEFQPLTQAPEQLDSWVHYNQLEVGLRRLTRIGGQYPGILVPLLAGGSQLGYILAMSSNTVFSVLDEITLERGSTIAALVMMHDRTTQEVERRYRNEYLVDLVEGAFPSDEVARQKAQTNGWHLQNQMRVLLIRFADLRKQTQKDRVLKFWTENYCTHCISGELGSDILVVTPTNHDPVEFCHRNFADMERVAESKLLVGIGRDSVSVGDIKYSFRQARGAVKIAAKVKSLGPIVHYSQLGIYRLLEEMSGKPQLSTYIQDNLKVLLDYDQENNTELVHTLCSYFEHGGNVKQIAQALYVHYNTVVYRLDRIEKLLKISLSNSQQRVSVEVAIRALEIIRKD